jgi:nitrogen fixation/metabolism regulation signal transduction histidine kinase
MRARTKYILFIVFIHFLFLALSWQLLERGAVYFIVAEGLIFISICISCALYKILVRPVNLIVSGTEMLKDKDFNSRLLKTGQAEADALVEVYNKMFDQLSAERTKHAEQNYFLEKLIYDSPAGIVVLDFEDNIISANPSAISFLKVQLKNITGRNINLVKNRLIQEMSKLEEGEASVISVSGSQLYRCRRAHFMDRGFKRTFFLIEEMAREVLKTERKAYEKIIRMMSHEVNNSTGAVNSFLDSFRNYSVQLNEKDKQEFENSLDIAINRNSRLSKFMINLSEVVKIPKPKTESCNLNTLLENTSKILSAEMNKRNIKCCHEYSDNEFIVNIDVYQFEQALLNIYKNSIESIGSNGVIIIITSNVQNKTEIIRDNGKGISPQVKSQIFTPFFSTKSQGQGIGLTMVREILYNHNCSFSLETVSDNSTEFKIEFSLLLPI